MTGVVDPSPAGRERAAQWGVPCYESITDLVEAGGVDVVDICTPTFLHRDNVMESLSLGKTTIVEKPAPSPGRMPRPCSPWRRRRG